MATGMTSWGQRKALGKRYAVDPALLLEQERLQNEYNLAPSREARALQADQFNRQLAFNAEQADQNRSDAAKSGMMGTVGGIAQNAAILRAMTMEKGQPFFGGLFGGGTSAPAATPGVTGGTAASTTATPAYTFGGGAAPFSAAPEGMNAASTYTFGGAPAAVNPALVDSAALAAEGTGAVGTASGTTAGGMAATGAAEGATLGGAASAGMAAAPYAAAGYLAAKYGGKLLENMAGGPDSSNAFAKAGRTMQTPFEGIGKPWLREMGVKNDTIDTVMKIANPISVVVDWFDGWF